LRILIISDLHANREAIEALPKEFDQMWVLGDLVNYGPDPAFAIDYVRRHAAMVVRGNHDHAVGFGEDPRCSARFRKMAEETCRYTRSILPEAELRHLRSLPLKAGWNVAGRHFLLCHAAPSNPLYEYRPPDSPLWFDVANETSSEIMLVGHTHLPFHRALGSKTVINPGSVGQPKHGRAEACYALWEDGKFTLHSAVYDVEATIDKLRQLPLSADVLEDLVYVLRNGEIPPAAVDRQADPGTDCNSK
jgi:putative phosphoesterase